LKTLIKNIGLMVSGDIAKPLLDGDSIVIADGKIEAVGKGLDGDADRS
jgi:enamidase